MRVSVSVPKNSERYPYVRVTVGGKRDPWIGRDDALRVALLAIRARGLKVEPVADDAAGLVIEGERYWGFDRAMKGVANSGRHVWLRAERPK
jgi:hypothetical protein